MQPLMLNLAFVFVQSKSTLQIYVFFLYYLYTNLDKFKFFCKKPLFIYEIMCIFAPQKTT